MYFSFICILLPIIGDQLPDFVIEEAQKLMYHIIWFMIGNAPCLTHLSLVPHICVSESGQHWFRNWLVTNSVPSHYLNQCLDIVNWTSKNTLQGNFKQNANLFIHENASENIVCETAPILSRERWVNRGHETLSPKTSTCHSGKIQIVFDQWTGSLFDRVIAVAPFTNMV